MVNEPPKSALAAGDVVGQRYRVVSLIGEGGQSYVYRGVDVRDGDDVALKVLKAKVRLNDPDAVERMFREAYAMATLRDTAALRVLDQTWTTDGAFCLVTELIQGVELGDFLDREETAGRRVEPTTILPIFEPIVRTLDAAHRQGIVHRDLKPSNIFLVDEARGGGVRLIDFGFAKFTRLRGFTKQHVIAGSPSYIAPEAWLNRRALFDQRLDVYALGALIYRCLAGHPPFQAANVLALLEAVTRAPRPSLVALRPDLPAAVDDWVSAALAIDPNERFQGVTALWTAFKNAIQAP
jgi:eukaryotic-like serine/threonine-protein kinase